MRPGGQDAGLVEDQGVLDKILGPLAAAGTQGPGDATRSAQLPGRMRPGERGPASGAPVMAPKKGKRMATTAMIPTYTVL